MNSPTLKLNEMKIQLSLSICLILFLISCDDDKQIDNYKELLQKVEIIPEHELVPPIASDIFFEELEEVDSNGNNIKLIAEFEKETIQSKYLALMLNDQKIVLRDDGVGADENEGDGKFSVNLKENLEELKSEFSQRQKLGFSEENTQSFKNRVITNIDKKGLIGFNVEELQKGKMARIPVDILTALGGLSDQEKTLMITDLSVVEDPTRTFNPCTQTGNPNGVWTFGELMRQMASPAPTNLATDVQVSNFVRNWLNTWSSNQTVNGELLVARTSIQNTIIDWENKSSVSTGGVLDMKFAPFKLTAIVNRLDLRGNSGYGFSNSGEGRLVFNLVNISSTSTCGNERPFTLIFEYGINIRKCASVKAFAEEWDNLNSLVQGSAAYNAALENITNQFVLSGTNTGKPNQNSINQIRTNDRALSAPWELREFNLKPSGQLELVDVKQEPQVKYNGFHSLTTSQIADVERFVDWTNNNTAAIIANNYTIPLNFPGTSIPFRGGHSLFPTDNVNQIWRGRGTSGSQFIVNNEARHMIALNACSTCHGGTTKTGFTHISPSRFGTEATLSGFLTGITVIDPANRPIGNPTSRTFNDLLRRENDLADLIANNCIKSPFLGLAHKLTFEPVRMTH